MPIGEDRIQKSFLTIFAAFAFGCGSGGHAAEVRVPDAMTESIFDAGAIPIVLDAWVGVDDSALSASPIGAFRWLDGDSSSCDAGHFIELTDDAGTRAFRSSCAGIDAAFPSARSCYLCAEDNPSMTLEGCSGSSWIRVEVGQLWACFAGGYNPAFITYDDGDGGYLLGHGRVSFGTRPTWAHCGGLSDTFTGVFEAYVGSPDDAGSPYGTPPTNPRIASGRFCLGPLGTF